MAFRLANKDKLLKPRKCLICEQKPHERVIDTGHNLNAATVMDKLRGRKYVCEACGSKIAKALGHATHHQTTQSAEEIRRLNKRINELTDQVDLQRSIEDLREKLGVTNEAPVEDEDAATA